MTNLARRVSALEAVAEDARVRRFRDMARVVAEEVGVSAEDLIREHERGGPTGIEELLARGATERQIIEHLAATSGDDVEELWQRYERISRRLGL